LKIQKRDFLRFLKWHFKQKRKKRNPKIQSFRIVTFIATHPHMPTHRPIYHISSVKDI